MIKRSSIRIVRTLDISLFTTKIYNVKWSFNLRLQIIFIYILITSWSSTIKMLKSFCHFDIIILQKLLKYLISSKIIEKTTLSINLKFVNILYEILLQIYLISNSLTYELLKIRTNSANIMVDGDMVKE